jgi:hypothetical protein
MRCGSAAIDIVPNSIVPNSAVIIAATIKKTKLRFTVIVRSSSSFAGHQCFGPYLFRASGPRQHNKKHATNNMLNVAARLWQIYEKAARPASSAAL